MLLFDVLFLNSHVSNTERKKNEKKKEWKLRSSPSLFTANVITEQYPSVTSQVDQIFGTASLVKISLLLA